VPTLPRPVLAVAFAFVALVLTRILAVLVAGFAEGFLAVRPAAVPWLEPAVWFLLWAAPCAWFLRRLYRPAGTEDRR